MQFDFSGRLELADTHPKALLAEAGFGRTIYY
jgi:hypothetical protein